MRSSLGGNDCGTAACLGITGMTGRLRAATGGPPVAAAGLEETAVANNDGGDAALPADLQ